MFGKTVSVAVAALLLTSMLTLAFDIQPVRAERTIIVPDDYPTIGAAISAAGNGDTIHVRSGIYYETLFINKSVAVIGENREATVIDGGGYSVLYVTASNVTISGFTIRNGSTGIEIQADWSTGTYPQMVEINGNTITNNTAEGILLRGISSTIFNNTITGSREGIRTDVAEYNNISYNIIASNYESGIMIEQDSPGNIFRYNNLSGNAWNFGVFAGNTYDFGQDMDSSNTVDGKPVYYMVNERDKQVPADAGYVAAIDCVNITVKDVSLTNNLQGVLFAGTTNSTIESVNVSDNWIGIHLMLASCRNIICSSNIENNEWRGIELMLGCSQNNISGNTITKNIPMRTASTPWYIPTFTPRMGIGLSLFGRSRENIIKSNWITLNGYGIYIGSDQPDNNTISENTIVHNYLYGVYLSSSGNNVFHNIFLDNWKQVYTVGSPNIWDDGYLSGGNYWTDYTGEDANGDGIGDTPYVIDDNSQDCFPLMAPWAPQAEHELVVVLQAPILLELGQSNMLKATVANRGLHSETDVTLSIIINGTVAKSTTIPSLNPNSLYTLSYLWAPGNEGRYNVTGYASELSGEENIANNQFTLHVNVKTPIVVPDDYATIQDAIEAANAEDTVFVKAGTYEEDVLVNKFGLRLVGQDPKTTTITKGIEVTVYKASIINFTIQGGSIGIEFENSEACTVTGNTITKNGVGIKLSDSSNNALTGNNITDNYELGIELSESLSNTISGNNITDTSEVGASAIYAEYSSGNTFSGNNITGQGDGISFWVGSSNKICGNEIANNTATGIKFMFTCNENEVYGNNITNNCEGICLSGFLSGSYKECPENNLIYENNIANNAETGVSLGGAGISPSGCLNNHFYHNNLSNNTAQVVSDNQSTNVWDDGYPSGGNYWSNYNGTDANHDGIGDIPYVIDASNTDRYPLTGMFSDFNATSEYYVQTICNSSITDFQFNGTVISFNVSGENTTGFCRICIPTALMNATYKVFVNGTEVQCNLLLCSNSTHNYLYFNYTHSTEEVVIIPEFLSVIILPLLMVLTMLAVVFAERKIPRRWRKNNC